MTATLTPFHCRLSTPLETAAGRHTHRDGWILRVGHDGWHGFGEATPLPGFTESDAQCGSALTDATETLQTDGWAGWPRAFAAVGDRPAARHALATALLDWRSRASGRPLYRSLGGPDDVSRVPVNATVGDGPVDDTVVAATAAVSDGFRAIKVKVGARPVEEDVERIAAVRDAVGGEVELRVDANEAWDRDTARTAVDALADLDVALVEQPLARGDLAGHRALRGAVPIALDESMVEWSVQEVVRADAADAVVLKPMALGGPDVASAAARFARANGLDVVVSNTIDAAVARTAAVHVAASIPEVRASGLATASLLETDVADDPAPVADGTIAVPQTPGLGIDEVTIDA